jgi:hypothetical protein
VLESSKVLAVSLYRKPKIPGEVSQTLAAKRTPKTSEAQAHNLQDVTVTVPCINSIFAYYSIGVKGDI